MVWDSKGGSIKIFLMKDEGFRFQTLNGIKHPGWNMILQPASVN